MRPLQWFGYHIACRRFNEFALESGEWLFHHHSNRDPQSFQPLLALLFLRDIEATKLDFSRTLAGAEIAPTVAYQIESRDSFRDTGGRIDVGRHLNDSMAKSDILGPRSAGGEENFRRRRMRVLFHKMMFGRPDIVVAHVISEFDLIECVLEQGVLRIARPRPRKLMFVKSADFHS